MEMLREINCDYHASDYIADGTNLYAFRAAGETVWKVFTKPLNHFSKTRRKFTKLTEAMPKGINIPTPLGVAVEGSKGNVYYVHEGKCTCPGFTFRGKCKHLELV